MALGQAQVELQKISSHYISILPRYIIIIEAFIKLLQIHDKNDNVPEKVLLTISK